MHHEPGRKFPLIINGLTLVSLIMSTCGPPIRDTVRTAVLDCREPQRGWITGGVSNLDSLGVHFVVVDSYEVPAVTVRCGDLGGTNPAAGSYVLGTDEVVVDPVYAPGEFGITAAANHELVHWYINRRGMMPDRARYHVCASFDQAPYCYPGLTDSNALMSPSLGGSSFDTGYEHVSTGDIPLNTPNLSDLSFFDWAVGRSVR